MSFISTPTPNDYKETFNQPGWYLNFSTWFMKNASSISAKKVKL
jgi:hypothetical protein